MMLMQETCAWRREDEPRLRNQSVLPTVSTQQVQLVLELLSASTSKPLQLLLFVV